MATTNDEWTAKCRQKTTAVHDDLRLKSDGGKNVAREARAIVDAAARLAWDVRHAYSEHMSMERLEAGTLRTLSERADEVERHVAKWRGGTT